MPNFSNIKNYSINALWLAIVFLLGSCTPEKNGPGAVNAPPTARFLRVVDINGGDFQIGDTLNCEYEYQDADGDIEGKSIYSYLRNNLTIPGAVEQTYSTVIEDSGQSISCAVQAVALTGVVTNEPLPVGFDGLSAPVPASETIQIGFSLNVPPTATAVTLMDVNGGDIEVDDVLMCQYIYDDIDGDKEGDSIYDYLRNNVRINGESEQVYTVVRDDIGQSLRCEVTPVAASGVTSGSPVISVNPVIPPAANSAPIASAISIVDVNGGDAEVGDDLRCDYTYRDADSDAEGATLIQWFAAGAELSPPIPNNQLLTINEDELQIPNSMLVGTSIFCQVIPVAISGVTVGANEISGTVIVDSLDFGMCADDTDCNAGESCVLGTCVGEGVLRFSLSWSVFADYDLHVITPDGNVISFRNRAADGGELDIDNTSGGSGAVENIFFDSSLTAGNYEFFVDNFNGIAGNFTIDVFKDGVRVQAEAGTLSDTRGEDSTHFDFIYQP